MFARWTSLLCFVDLVGPDGRPSFSKFMCVAVFVAALADRISLGMAVAILSASFGRAMWSAFLTRWRGSTTEVITESRVKSLAIEAVRAEPNVWRGNERG